uniref:Uncharacterized protein n=1 Tax=viral metagenome TaxID=1070528 RepID=A0A6M3LWD6_9ZZZZ
MLSVRDTVLYVADKPGIRTVAAHIKTKPKPRLSDGKRHPITIIYPDGRREVRR